MKKILAFLTPLLFPLISAAQIDLNSRNKPVSYFIKLEKQYKSTLFTFKNAISFDTDGEEKAVIYRRKQNKMPDLLVYYYASTRAPGIAEIYYDWNEVNFLDPSDTHRLSMSQLIPYVEKYKELLSQVEKKYGKGETEGSLDTSRINSAGLTRSDKWKTDSAEIKLEIELSNNRPYPTNLIHLLITNSLGNQQQETGASSKKEIAKLDSIARLFIKSLVAGKFDDARKYLSAQNTQSLQSLQDFIKDEQWVQGGFGQEVMLPGNKLYTNLSYNREADTNKPPLELLTFLFDDKDKITAIQPLKRRAGQ